MRNIAIDGSRPWDSLMEMAKFRAIERGGWLLRAVARNPDRGGEMA